MAQMCPSCLYHTLIIQYIMYNITSLWALIFGGDIVHCSSCDAVLYQKGTHFRVHSTATEGIEGHCGYFPALKFNQIYEFDNRPMQMLPLNNTSATLKKYL